MGEAVQNLTWIENQIVPKIKYDSLSDEEKKGKFPIGVLKRESGKMEYCEAYDKVIEAAKNKTAVKL